MRPFNVQAWEHTQAHWTAQKPTGCSTGQAQSLRHGHVIKLMLTFGNPGAV